MRIFARLPVYYVYVVILSDAKRSLRVNKSEVLSNKKNNQWETEKNSVFRAFIYIRQHIQYTCRQSKLLSPLGLLIFLQSTSAAL